MEISHEFLCWSADRGDQLDDAVTIVASAHQEAAMFWAEDEDWTDGQPKSVTVRMKDFPKQTRVFAINARPAIAFLAKEIK